MYRRRRRVASRAVKAVRYSNETYCQSVPSTVGVGDWNSSIAICMVPATQTAGMRKAKNFTLSMQYIDLKAPLAFALVYVPQNQDPQDINRAVWSETATAPTSLYEPNQNVIMQGLVPLESNGRIEFKTRLARNLNSGDSVFLVLRTIADITTSPTFSCQLNFAICY